MTSDTPMLVNTPVIETDRLVLRAPQPGDWPACRAMMMSERARFIGGPAPEGRAWRSFSNLTGHWVLRGYGNFVFCLKGSDDALGMTGAWYPADWPERELGCSVWAPEAEGKGLAFEAASAARDHIFDALGWDTAVSYIDPDNTRSIRLAERLGARLDTGAATPPDTNCLVYRHPAPRAA